MTAAVTTPHRVPYPLWAIILACAAIAGVGMGLRQVMGLYQKDITSDLGIGREAFGLAIAIANITWGIAAPFAGAVSDTYGTGRVVLFGAVNTVVGILLMWAAASESQLLISGVFMGLGVAGAGVNATVGAVSRAAAPSERSAAIAKVGMGAGVGVFLALPYAHLLIEVAGWKSSLFILAMTALVMLPLAIPVAGKPVAGNPLVKKQTLGEALAKRSAIRASGFSTPASSCAGSTSCSMEPTCRPTSPTRACRRSRSAG
jgi:MFS family permease